MNRLKKPFALCATAVVVLFVMAKPQAVLANFSIPAIQTIAPPIVLVTQFDPYKGTTIVTIASTPAAATVMPMDSDERHPRSPHKPDDDDHRDHDDGGDRH